jgi:hypothetical protein
VRFLVRSRGGTLFFTPAEAVLAVPIFDRASPLADTPRQLRPSVAGTSVVRLHYQDANPARVLQAGTRLPSVVNYLYGDNPAKLTLIRSTGRFPACPSVSLPGRWWILPRI